MNKKLWTLLIAVLLVVVLSVSLIACSGNTTEDPVKQSSSLQIKGGNSSQVVTKSIQINETSRINLTSSAVMSATDIASKILVKDQYGTAVVPTITKIDDSGKAFRASAPTAGYVAGRWYSFELLDSNLSFTDYAGANKLSMYVVADEGTAAFADNVTYLSGGSQFISNYKETGALKTFEFDSIAANQTLKMGQIVLVEDVDTAEYVAYQILGVEETANAGIYTVSYAAPSYDEVYEELIASSVAVLGEDGTVTINEEEIEGTISEQLALAGFSIGIAKFEINPSLDKDNKKVSIDVKVTLPDLVGTKDGANSLDVILDFKIETTIILETDISIGALLAAKDNGIELITTFDNDLSFTVEVDDYADIADQSELDAVLAKIANMIKNSQEDDISIDIFNWVIPIGNGIADINFDVNLDMNFYFSGALGVTSTSNAVLTTRTFFNPSTEEKGFEILDKSFEFKSVEVYLDADAAAYIGIDATIKFDLLGGVISVGVGAEVGNFNKVYGSIATTNLLESTDFCYGVYFEGGIYYDAKFLYNVAKITSGAISFLGGRQEKVLYSAGSPYVVTALQDTYMNLGVVAQEIAIQCQYKDIVNGTSVNTWTNIIDAKKVKEADGADVNDYVVIENGTIRLTEAGLAATINNYVLEVEADGVNASIIINKIDTVEVAVGVETSIVVDGTVKTITAAYTDGTTVDVTFSGNTAKVTGDKEGVIVLTVNGEAYKIVSVK